MFKDEQIKIILYEYQNQNEWQRHNENQRAQLVNILLVISAALLSLFFSYSEARNWHIPLILIFIGIFGILSVMKYWERFNYHLELENNYRKLLDLIFPLSIYENENDENEPSNKLEHLFIITRNEALKNHKKDTFFLLNDCCLKQHWLWEIIFFLILSIGIILLISK